MQLTSENRIFVVTNYLRTRCFKDVQQHFEQRFLDRVLPTKMTIWKIIKKYKAEDKVKSKQRSPMSRRTERIQENINCLQEKLV